MALEEPLFSELVQRLHGEKGMRRKVRLLAGSWSLLQKLSPQQREHLGLAIGNRWAWRNIESLFGNPESLSDNQRQVKEFFDSMRETDPAELRQIGREVKEGNFNTVKSRVMEAVEEALDDETAVEGELPEPVQVEPEPEPDLKEEVAVGPQVGPVAAPEVVERQPDSSTPAPQDPSGEPEESQSAEAPVAESPNMEPQAVDPEPGREPEPEADPQIEPVERSESQDSTAEPAATEDEPFAAYRTENAALSAVDSMRILRQLASGDAASTRAGRAALVESLSSGWAARRAVSALIRSHAAADLGEALALVRQLPTDTQRTWCLGDLVEFWDLDEEARRSVLAAAPTDAARRRLARRAQRAG